jgi:hypothetical protein
MPVRLEVAAAAGLAGALLVYRLSLYAAAAARRPEPPAR